jgi:hypothetical protein
MAEATGISVSLVQRIRKAHVLVPHRVCHFKLQVFRTEPTDRGRRSPLSDYGADVSHGGGDAIDPKPPSYLPCLC